MSKINFYDAWYYLVEHPIFQWEDFSYFEAEALDIHVAKVNPESRCVEDDETLNTHTEIWLECGPVEQGHEGFPMGTHDAALDCGGDTFEEAIIELYKLVKKNYPIK